MTLFDESNLFSLGKGQQRCLLVEYQLPEEPTKYKLRPVISPVTEPARGGENNRKPGRTCPYSKRFNCSLRHGKMSGNPRLRYGETPASLATTRAPSSDQGPNCEPGL
jgi:hypothetical protein